MGVAGQVVILDLCALMSAAKIVCNLLCCNMRLNFITAAHIYLAAVL